jgi:hypothetical protein
MRTLMVLTVCWSGVGCISAPSLGQSGAAPLQAEAGTDDVDAAARVRPPYAGAIATRASNGPNTALDAGLTADSSANAGAGGRTGAHAPVAGSPSWAAGASGGPGGRTAGAGGVEIVQNFGMAAQPSAAGARAQPNTSAPSRAGQLVITELMVDPKTLRDSEGEWFELQNITTQSFDLQGCEIDDGGKELRPITESVRVAPLGYVTVARTEQVGFRPNYVTAISLSNDADTLALRCAAVDIDRVAYDKQRGFPIVAGASLSLDPSRTRADVNDDASAWCIGTTSYGPERGTPGAANPPCDGDDAGVHGG